MNQYLDISPEVKEALAAGKPVVALESTIISHGMPYPKNVETALRVEQTIRDHGAVPATIAVIGGRLKAGLSHEEIEYLGKTGRGVAKASRRDLPALVARKADGATTVATTMIIAHMAGINMQLISMIPYVVTVIVLVLFVGKSRVPSANGKPFIKAK